MQLKTGIIVGLALVLSGCATSPFFVSKERASAPGFVPRNELGEPVLPAVRTPGKQTPAADTTPRPPAPRHSSWLTK